MHEAPFHRGGSTPKHLNGISAQATTSDFIPQPGADFVATEAVQELTNRALAYIEIGYAVHLSGPAGTGKTTLALHIASKIGRRCTLLHGDDELRGSDLLGKDAGYRRQSVRDNYVSSILKTEETVS
jgi:nitric oxide reductase NorQ protein